MEKLKDGDFRSTIIVNVASRRSHLMTDEWLGYSPIGTEGYLKMDRQEGVHHVSGSYSKILGGHTLKAGAEMRWNFLDYAQPGYPSGQFTFGRGITEKYLVPYNRKIWKTEPKQMGVEWVELIPKPQLRRSLEDKEDGVGRFHIKRKLQRWQHTRTTIKNHLVS